MKEHFPLLNPMPSLKILLGTFIEYLKHLGLKIIAAKMLHLTREEAEAFYDVHATRPFFKSLVSFMMSGPIMIQVLEGDNAVLRHREIMGATDPIRSCAWNHSSALCG